MRVNNIETVLIIRMQGAGHYNYREFVCSYSERVFFLPFSSDGGIDQWQHSDWPAVLCLFSVSAQLELPDQSKSFRVAAAIHIHIHTYMYTYTYKIYIHKIC